MTGLPSGAQSSRTAEIRRLAKEKPAAAVEMLGAFLEEIFRIDVLNLRINHDQYSLNSLNGFFETGEDKFFFKFHQEEGEEDMKGEYYRADLIANAGLPVDLPVLMSTLPGEQILVYKKRDDRRFSDVLRDLDIQPEPAAIKRAAIAERRLNENILDVSVKTLHPVTRAQVEEEAIHHLFYDRLRDPRTGTVPGGRYQRFYIDQEFEFNGACLSWDAFSSARLILNGTEMASTFGGIFASATRVLKPENMTRAGGLTAHGDAHNANVWFVDTGTSPELTYFDPAFAGEHVPALLAEVKATFHNVFAHPFWLYDPGIAAEQFDASATYANGVLEIDTDWSLSPVRERLLSAKIEAFWKPFLAHLKAANMLPGNWEQVLRAGFAMCPTLVMNLRAGADRHNRTSSAIGFYIAALAGSKPADGETMFTKFFERIDPHWQPGPE